MEAKINFSNYSSAYVQHFQAAWDNLSKLKAEKYFARRLRKPKQENRIGLNPKE